MVAKPYFRTSHRYEKAVDRLSFVMRAVGAGPSALARQLGLPGPELFYRIAEEELPMPPELARGIHERWPQIDLGWLLTGQCPAGTGSSATGSPELSAPRSHPTDR